jgi:dienelactone hydrolase
MRIRRLLFGMSAAVFLFCLGCGGKGDAPMAGSQELRFRSGDGVDLAATLYVPARPHPPGLILAHEAGADRRRWEAMAQTLRDAGYMAIALDMRGHGASTLRDGAVLNYRTFSAEDWIGAWRDFESAREQLLRRGADPENLAVAGEGLGANLALYYARREPSMQAVVMVSPELDDQGIKSESIIQELNKRPVLLMAAENDVPSATSATALKAAASGFTDLRIYPGNARGVDLLAASDDASAQLLNWLNLILTKPR